MPPFIIPDRPNEDAVVARWPITARPHIEEAFFPTPTGRADWREDMYGWALENDCYISIMGTYLGSRGGNSRAYVDRDKLTIFRLYWGMISEEDYL